jgi:3-deoxy-D-arabino-heptulosonate 7-phosphate (DAHP) synthase
MNKSMEPEQTLAEEYATKIKAVAETKEAEIETLYREYQEKCRLTQTTEGQGDGIKSAYQATDSVAASDQSNYPQTKG